MPLTTSLTKGSAMLVTTTPIVLVFCVTRPRAIALARHTHCLAMCWILSAVSRLIKGLLCRARETVEEETLARRAISLMDVGLCTGCTPELADVCTTALYPFS